MGDKLTYTYAYTTFDCGEDWSHKVVVEKLVPTGAGDPRKRPAWVAGRRRARQRAAAAPGATSGCSGSWPTRPTPNPAPARGGSGALQPRCSRSRRLRRQVRNQRLAGGDDGP